LAKQGISRSFQILNLVPEMTLFENISISAQAEKGHGFELFSQAEKFSDVTDSSREIIDQIGLAGKEDILAKNLGYGDRRILEIAVALASNPKLLLLDEPTSGLPTNETSRITDLIGQLSKTVTVVMIEHDMNIVLSISHEIAVMHQGKLIALGNPEEIKRNKQVQDAYLGGLA
jgi:branched-chain amino acid transport system ATP-binding protein